MGVNRKYLMSNCAEDIVSDDDLARAFRHTNFGGRDPREVVRTGVLKCLAGWHQGHTSKTIGQELGLISAAYRVTAKGKHYLWHACNKGQDV